MNQPTQKLAPVNEPLTFNPFQYLDIQGWGIIITQFAATEENVRETYVPHIIIWLKNGEGVTPLVLSTNGIAEPSAEHAVIAVFTTAEPIFGDKINPYADVINEAGEKIDTIYVVDLILEHEANMRQFFDQMQGQNLEGDGLAEPKKVLH